MEKTVITIDNFNSIKVRLNPTTARRGTRFELHFNSIKVRLNRAACCVNGRSDVFQFHKGTIKPEYREWQEEFKPKFQFHKGTIKPYRFNSYICTCLISIP